MNDASTWYVLNTKGTKDADGHEVSDEIKQMLSWMNGNKPQSEYTRMLDAAVQDVKQSDERRREYMSIYANIADEREVGDYRTYVRTIRTNKRNLTDDILADTFEITTKTINNIRMVINNHPDWDDDDVAEEVLDLEDEPF